MKYSTLRKKVETTPLQICEKGNLEVFGLSKKLAVIIETLGPLNVQWFT